MTDLSALFGGLSLIAGVCPNPDCGELFRLSDARPFLKGKKPASILDELDAEIDRIDRAQERLELQEQVLRDRARQAGQRQAKRRLKKIDPAFSGCRLDPQDVKVIFDPVEYVVFDGLNAGKLDRVVLLGHPPASRAQERLFKSIARTVRKGNLDFRTLRVLENGALELE